MNPDGSNQTNLANHRGYDDRPHLFDPRSFTQVQPWAATDREPTCSPSSVKKSPFWSDHGIVLEGG